MIWDGTENGVLRLMKSKLEPWRWLHKRGAAKVLDTVPRNRVELLIVHGFFIQSEGLFTSKQAGLIICRGRCGGLMRVRCKR